MSKKWQIFVVFHKYLVDEFYQCDKTFSHDHYTYVKCNPSYKAEYNPKFVYKVIEEQYLKNYKNSLQSKSTPYHAASVVYHLHKSGFLYMPTKKKNVIVSNGAAFNFPLVKGTLSNSSKTTINNKKLDKQNNECKFSNRTYRNKCSNGSLFKVKKCETIKRHSV